MNTEYLNELVTQLKQELLSDSRLPNLNDTEVEYEIREQVIGLQSKLQSNFTLREKAFLERAVFDAIRGLGVLDEINRNEDITEVMINGHDKIFVEINGKQMRYDGQFESKEDLADKIKRFVQKHNRSVSEANPIVDTRLEDGSRVNVVMPPIALDGATVTIRRFPKNPMTIQKLIDYGSITPEVAEVLRNLVEAKFNIFISGGTGSGKTTFLNALSNFIPPTDRVITAEDSAELRIVSVPNLVRLETKETTNKEAKAIGIKDLIKSALRMRPDRIIVGEVRGAEAVDMLQAMNTGHDGSMSTGHANTAKDMLSRLETMVMSGDAKLPLEAVRQQIASALDIIIQLSRLRDHSRKTVEIVEVLGYNRLTNEVELNPIYTFVESEDSTVEKVAGALTRTQNTFQNQEKLHLAGKYIKI